MIKCTVNCHQRYTADLPQGDLEVSCFLVFIATNDREANKIKELLSASLGCKNQYWPILES